LTPGFVLFLSLVGASAGAAEIKDLDAPVPGLSGRTWADVVRRIVSDARPTGDPFVKMTGREGIELRSLDGGESKPQWDKDIRITGVLAEPVIISGRNRLIVSLRLKAEDTGVAPLVLMEGEGEGRVLDALDVATDMHTSFEEPLTRRLGADGVLVVVKGWHDNSSQSYDIRSLVMAGPEKFTRIGSVSSFGEGTCDRKMTQTARIDTKPAQPFAEIRVSVTRKTSKLRRSDCETVIGKPKTEVIRGSFRWDPARNAYVGDTKALERLAKENEERF
jgi:hypothetical protein